VGGGGNWAGRGAGAKDVGSGDHATGGTETACEAVHVTGGADAAEGGTENADGAEEAVAVGARQPPDPSQAGAASSTRHTTHTFAPTLEGYWAVIGIARAIAFGTDLAEVRLTASHRSHAASSDSFWAIASKPRQPPQSGFFPSLTSTALDRER
jgi:hypothetical protein